MGLFSSKKKTYVASTCYNLAGDENERPDYLKSVVVGAVISGDRSVSLGEAIQNGFTGGPGAKLKSYYRWARDNYEPVIGFSSSGLASAPDVNAWTVASYVSAAPGNSVSVQSVKVGPADLEVWAEQWVLNNAYAQFNDEWRADFDEATGEVVVTLPLGSVHRFVPAGFDKDATYVFATYNEVTEGVTMPTTVGSTIALATGAAFPSTSGWTTTSFTTTPRTVPAAYNETHGVYTKTELIGNESSVIVYSLTSVMYQDQTGRDNGSGGLIIDRTYKINTTQTVIVDYSPLKVFIYKVGSGIAELDGQVSDNSGGMSGFFPPIPVRINNQFVSESFLPSQYEHAKKAFKKLIGGTKFDDMIVSLEDNPDLGDIDYVYVVPGVSLNVKENACRKYLYKFFANAMATSLYGETEYASWGVGTEDGKEAMNLWRDWLTAQTIDGNPMQGSAEPPRGSYAASATNEILVKATADSLGYDTRISWSSIKEDAGSGLSRPGAVKGDVWLTSGNSLFSQGLINGGSLGDLDTYNTTDLLIYWQLSAVSWKRLTIRELVHRNYVYGGKFVEISAQEALEDLDDSGFIVPLHYETLNSVSAKDCAQMSTACLFIVINTYQTVKLKWYQTGWFKLLAIIVVVALTIIFPPAGLVGASAFTIAAVTLTNILISMIMFRIIQSVSIELFGRKAGTIIAIVASFLAMNPEILTQSLGESLTYLSQVEQLTSFTSAVGQVGQAIGAMKVQDLANKNQSVLDNYSRISKELSDLYAKNLGSDFSFDAMSLTSSSNADRFVVEPRSVFLARTLMTGSDIAELSNSLVSDFASLTLNTELPV